MELIQGQANFAADEVATSKSGSWVGAEFDWVFGENRRVRI